jgi:hypothetical protein
MDVNDALKVVLVEYVNEDPKWVISFDGHNPAEDRSIACTSMTEAKKLKKLIEEGRVCIWHELVKVRELLAEAYVELSGKEVHASDCAVADAPALTPRRCDC